MAEQRKSVRVNVHWPRVYGALAACARALKTYPITLLMLAANVCFRRFRSSHTPNVCCGAVREKQPFSLSLSEYWDMFLGLGRARERRVAEAWLDAALAQAKAHSPAVFAASSQHEPERQRKFEHVCAWLAAYWPHIPPAARQGVLEALIDRLEIGLREASVGDLQVGRQIRAMAAAAHGRLQRYGGLLLQDDVAALATALGEHGVAPELAERLREPLPKPQLP